MADQRALQRLHGLDTAAACRLAEAVRSQPAVAVLRGASWLGNWMLTAVTAAVLLAVAGPGTALRFLLAGAVGVLLQQGLKEGVARVRPCLTEGGPHQRVSIPDAGSFPSGHTLHAVLAATTVVLHAPWLAAVYVPVALLVAVSRVALGVHYPSDVAAGAVLGAAFAAAVQLL